MSRMPKNHNELYFDKLIRTNKAESLLSMIQATYHAQKNLGTGEVIKNKIAKRLEYAFCLFRDDIKGSDSGAGTYDGNISQFDSQYTFGLEMGIWTNSNFKLSELAIKVADNRITIRDYFDIVMLNYFQPVNNVLIHPLYLILSYLIEKKVNQFSINDITNYFKSHLINCDNEMVRLLMNSLIASNYFKIINNSVYEYCSIHDKKTIFNCCNIEYIEKGYEKAKTDFQNDEDYYQYLTTDYRPEAKNQHEIRNEIYLSEIGYNRIYYGIPGCGKSYYIEHTLLNGVDKINDVVRTTFYLDYTNSDFIGQIYPQMEIGTNDENKVTYKSLPGPFTVALEKAYSNPNKMIYLIIEEINRGNAAAIFGDLFQLLDRLDREHDGRVKGDSEYPINNEFISGYFKQKNIDIPRNQEKIFIPNNLSIIATMNTSDQNVFPLDTAFKRRWDRDRVIPNCNDVQDKFNNMYIPFTNITWENFINKVNEAILSGGDDGIILEDKQLGPFFIKESMLVSESERKENNINNQEKLRQFVNNVIDYLYNDVTKFEHDILFSDKYKSYEEVYEAILKFLNNEFVGDESLCLKVFEFDINESYSKESDEYEQ